MIFVLSQEFILYIYYALHGLYVMLKLLELIHIFQIQLDIDENINKHNLENTCTDGR